MAVSGASAGAVVVAVAGEIGAVLTLAVAAGGIEPAVLPVVDHVVAVVIGLVGLDLIAGILVDECDPLHEVMVAGVPGDAVVRSLGHARRFLPIRRAVVGDAGAVAETAAAGAVLILAAAVVGVPHAALAVVGAVGEVGIAIRGAVLRAG